MKSLLNTVLLLTLQIVHFKFCVSVTETKDKISNIFEGLGYNPSCVAKSLALCDNSAKSSYGKEITDAIITITGILNEMKPAIKEPKNCAEIKVMGDCQSGVRNIYPSGCSAAKPVEVFCDQTTDGGGWIVFQKRDNLTVREDFYRSWDDYVAGFGNLTGEFWLGLDKIQALVSSTKMEMRVDLEDYEGEKRWAKYSTFSIGDSSTKYKINIGGYTGDAGDGFRAHDGQKFSTKDQDNDNNHEGNCAETYKGAWWYYACHESNLNGLPHVGKHASYADGINWQPWKEYYYSFRKTSMKIRPL